MGKDNIVFHSQIWPAEMLAQNGKGSRGGDHNPFGQLNLPTEVVSSEFLTMEGKKFSSSHGIVIYVRDVLSRYQADALRYFISIAGPETADADFTWAEFVRRTNSELVAAWGNLVNRTASMIHKRFGQIPEPGEFTFEDRSLLSEVERGFKTVGDLIMHHRQKAALSEAMRLVGEANRYIAETEPFKLKSEEQQERLRTILFVLAQVCAEHGWYASVSGPVTYKSNRELRAAIAAMPQQLLLIETDAPYLPPTPYRGMPNGSYLLPVTLTALAQLRQLSLEQMCQLVNRNSHEVYGF